MLDLPVIHLILQPLLENSLHHGIKELPRKGLIKIRILKRSSRVHISVIDNGIGMEKAYLKSLRESLTRTEFGENRHIGIYNTNLRLILTYGPESALKIQSRAGWGTIIHFSLPAEK